MRLEMVDGDQRRTVHQRDRLGGGQADDDAADQAGPRGGGNGGQLLKTDAGFGHGAADDAVEQIDMGARRDLRYHAAERRMIRGLRVHDVGQDAGAAKGLTLDHGGRGFIAGRLDPQHQHRRFEFQFEPLHCRANQRLPCPA